MMLPKWSTPARQVYLIDLFNKCGGFCVYGHWGCQIESHQYQNYIDGYDTLIEVTESVWEIQSCPKTVSDTGYIIGRVMRARYAHKHMPGLIDGWIDEDREDRLYQEYLDSQNLQSKAYTGACLEIARQGVDHTGLPIIEVNIREAPVTLFVSSEPKVKVKSKNRRHKEARYWHRKAVTAYNQYWQKQGSRI